MEISVKRAEPRQMRVVVRSPADFPAHSRSSPMRAPSSTARKSRARDLAQAERLREKITQALKTMEESGREQINLTDPDCALMHSV